MISIFTCSSFNLNESIIFKRIPAGLIFSLWIFIIPLLLNKVHPIHEVVKIDYFLPGCPPSGDAIWTFLNELLAGQEISLPYQAIHYD